MAFCGLLFIFFGMCFLALRFLSFIDEKEVKKHQIIKYRVECYIYTFLGSLFVLVGFVCFYFFYSGIEDLITQFYKAIPLLLPLSIFGILISYFLYTQEIDSNHYEERFLRPPRDLNKAKIRYKIFSVTLFLLCVSYLVYWALRSDWLRILLNK